MVSLFIVYYYDQLIILLFIIFPGNYHGTTKIRAKEGPKKHKSENVTSVSFIFVRLFHLLYIILIIMSALSSIVMMKIGSFSFFIRSSSFSLHLYSVRNKNVM